MTSFSLLLWIVLGVALQLAIFLGIVFWRHWLDYLALRNGGAGLNVPVGPDMARLPEAVDSSARQDFRSSGLTAD